MSILKFLGLAGSTGAPRHGDGDGDTATVRRIVQKLESMDPARARFVAAFAFILARVANADLDISDDETRAMEEIVKDFGGLDEEQAVLVVQIAKSQNRLFGGTENFLVTREFRNIATHDQYVELLHCLFAVAAADDSISTGEEEGIRQIANELGLDHREYVEVRAAYSDKREVIRRLHEQLHRGEN